LNEPSFTDPANDENVIDAYLDEDGMRGILLDLVARERQIVEKASLFEKDGDYEKALKEWKNIFESDIGYNNFYDPKLSNPTIISHPPKQHCNVQISRK
jgi:hypothetical protein